MKKLTKGLTSLLLALGLLYTGCAVDVDSGNKSNAEYGSIVIQNENAVEAGELSRSISGVVTSALVTVKSSDIKTDLSTTVSVVDGKNAGKVVIENIPCGKNRVVTVQSYDEKGNPVQGGVMTAVADVKAGENSVSVNWNSSISGNVYLTLLENGQKIAGATYSGLDELLAAFGTAEKAPLINTKQIAYDVINGSLKAASEYKLAAGKLKISSDKVNGYTVTVNDPVSAKEGVTLSAGSSSVLSEVAPGSWTVTASNGTESVSKAVTVSEAGITNVKVSKGSSVDLSNKSIVFVKADSAPCIWAWEANGKALSEAMGGKWNTSSDAVKMVPASDEYMENTAGWYMIDYTDYVTSGNSKVIKFKLNWGGSEITGKAGSFWYDGTSSSSENPSPAASSVVITVEEPEIINNPSVAIVPANGELSLSDKITVSLDAGNGTILSAEVIANNKVYSLADFTNNVLSIEVNSLGVSEGDAVSVKAVCSNEKGQASVTSAYKVKEADSMKVYVSSISGAPKIWLWQDSGKSCSSAMGYTWDSQPSMTPASDMNVNTNWYVFVVSEGAYKAGCEYSFILNKSSTTVKTGKTGTFWYDAAGISGNKVANAFYDADPTVKPVPVKPIASIAPATGSEVYLDEKFTITTNFGNDTLSVNNATINGKNYTLSEGSNVFNVRDFASNEGDTVSVSVVLTNSKGTASESAVYTAKVRIVSTEIPSDWNQLRIYQVMVSSFQDGDSSIGYTRSYGPQSAIKGGDLQGVINALDYIKKLGCNAIWMTPIFDSNGDSELDSTGYFTYDYFNVDPKFGTNEKFAELVEEAHSRGIAVILDGVFGHHKSTGAKTSPNGNYTVSKSGKKYNPVDYHQGKTLEFFKEVAAYWITNYKIDGWRFDQDYQVGGSYTDGQGGYNFWKDIRETVEWAASQNGTKGKDWGTLGYMVGEDWQRDDATIQNNTVAGNGLPSTFDFPARYGIVDSIAEEEWNDHDISLGWALGQVLYEKASKRGLNNGAVEFRYNAFITNHDLLRLGDLINLKYGVGTNNAMYKGKHKVALACLAGYSGPLTIYYGDEWGAMVGGLSSPMTVGSTKPVGDGAYFDNASRSTGKISGFTSDEQEIIDWTSQLMAMRENNPIMWKGDTKSVWENAHYFVGKKTYEGKTAMFIINDQSSSVSYNFGSTGTDMMTGAKTGSTVTCPAYSAVFVLLD